MLRLYKLSQDVNDDWDTYDSCVVAAQSPAKAKAIHPSGTTDRKKWHNWAHPSAIKVECIGTAKRGIKPGVIVASFNAG